jgi:hypothetical protein
VALGSVKSGKRFLLACSWLLLRESGFRNQLTPANYLTDKNFSRFNGNLACIERLQHSMDNLFRPCAQILRWISLPEGTLITVQVIKGNVNDPLHLFLRHLSLQYLTLFQFFAHFLRHSKGRPHRTHTLGLKPFLLFACFAVRVFIVASPRFLQ